MPRPTVVLGGGAPFRVHDENPELIGLLEEEWNHFDRPYITSDALRVLENSGLIEEYRKYLLHNQCGAVSLTKCGIAG